MKFNRSEFRSIVVWVVLLVFMIPGIINYSHYLTYSAQQESTGQSAEVEKLLFNSSTNRETLIIVVNESPFNLSLASKVLALQGNLSLLPGVISTSSPFSEYELFIASTVGNLSVAKQYVEQHGLYGSPSFLRAASVSADNSTFLVTIQLNYTSGTTLAGGTSPSQEIVPKVEQMVHLYLGNEAYVTGNGALKYETQQLTQRSAFVFPVLFVVLAIAVGLTLYSFKGSLLALLFVSLTTIIGYFAVFVTGILLKSVDYVVNYTLTAVLLGITTDYLVFIASRYKEELKGGREKAIEAASKKASKTVLISGLTVGLSLATFSLVPGFLSWGVVLLIAILISTAMMVTLLPSILSVAGMRLFSTPSKESRVTNSYFYRAATLKRKGLIVAFFVVLTIPAAYLFFHLPTTYNFDVGLPSDLRSVQGLNILQAKFGAYTSPIIVVVNSSAPLRQEARTLIETPGVSSVVGPYADGRDVLNSSNVSQFQVGRYVYFVIYSNVSPYSPAAAQLVKQLRGEGFLVGGVAASIVDLESMNTRNYSLLEILIVTVVGLVLGLSFRSWKDPLASLTGVFMSVTWTTGLLYLISTYVLKERLIYLVPVILFVILMSLGNDYTVFILSRVREEGNVPVAMAKTGRTVTSLGLILAVSLGVLTLIPVGFLQQLGVAFFVSLLIDTFAIRSVYLPSVLQFLKEKPTRPSEGDRNSLKAGR